MKFIVTGIINVEVTATIEADNATEAENFFDSADVCVETCDGDITITEGSQCGSSVDSVTWPAADKWESLSRLERANILKENGVSDDCAIEVSDRDYLSEIDSEWWEYFEE